MKKEICENKECPAYRPCGCFQNLEKICKKFKAKEEICENCKFFELYGHSRMCNYPAVVEGGYPNTRLTRKIACKKFKAKKEICECGHEKIAHLTGQCLQCNPRNGIIKCRMFKAKNEKRK